MESGLKERLARQASGSTSLDFDRAGGDDPRLVSIPIDLISPDPQQPRRNLGDLAELEASIREHGLIHPIIVDAVGPGRYRVIAGERRLAACRNLQLKAALCIVRTVAEHSRLTLQLVENLQRKDLHPLEEARAFQRLMKEFDLTQRDLALRLGKSVGAINQTLRILSLNPEVLADAQTSEHATKSLLLEIAKETEPERQAKLWEEARDGSMSVRTARGARPTVSLSPPRKSTCTIEVPDARVIIRFSTGPATPDRVCEALKAAADQQQPRKT